MRPFLVLMDWICWINPFNMDFWALFSSYQGGGILSISLDWNSIGGSTMWLPLATQLNIFGGQILSYWIIMPILWLTNTMRAKTFGAPLTASLFYTNGTAFHIIPFLNKDYTLNTIKYDAGLAVTMTPMYA